jgi:hypothetical protein
MRKSDLVGRLAPATSSPCCCRTRPPRPHGRRPARIRQAIGGHTFPRRRRLGADVGVACYPADGPDAAALLARATRDLIGRAGA